MIILDACGVARGKLDSFHRCFFSSVCLLPTWQRRLCFGSVGRLASLSVDNITQKVINGLG